MILFVMGRALALNGLNKQCDQDFQGILPVQVAKKYQKSNSNYHIWSHLVLSLSLDEH